jgi:hypothetical protein
MMRLLCFAYMSCLTSEASLALGIVFKYGRSQVKLIKIIAITGMALGFTTEAPALTISQPDAFATFGAGAATGQAFTATLTGIVTQIDIRSRMTTTSATLYIYQGNNGSGVIGNVGTPDYIQTSISLIDAGGDSASFGFSDIFLSTPFPVIAGQQYSFVIAGAAISGTNLNPYSGGTKLDNYAGVSANQDIAFQVHQNAIPVPATASLVSLGALLLPARMFRRTRRAG